MSFKTLSSEYINRHPYFTARKDSYASSDGKIVDPYFVVELPVSATAMAMTENNEVIFVKQYRHPIKDYLFELPGGFVDNGELPTEAIRRELLEETGYSFSSIHPLAITTANPGVLDNFTHLFIALGGTKTAEQQLDANEAIEVIFKSLEEAKAMLKHNEIKQSMHALCMFYAFEFLKDKGLY